MSNIAYDNSMSGFSGSDAIAPKTAGIPDWIAYICPLVYPWTQTGRANTDTAKSIFNNAVTSISNNPISNTIASAAKIATIADVCIIGLIAYGTYQIIKNISKNLKISIV